MLNVSEGRNKSVVQTIARAAIEGGRASTKTPPTNDSQVSTSVLNIFNDYDYNRSVITIVGNAEDLGDSVSAACIKACDLIDLRTHDGGHPRLGAIDLVPIHPISEGVTLEECGALARDIAGRVTSAVPGASVFFFGQADRPACRSLVQRRKQVRWYDGCHGSSYDGIAQDVGAKPTAQYGLTGIGAIPYVTNCNVTIATKDVEFGREIAKSVRAVTPGGLPGVEAMAFAHDDAVEVACNVTGMLKDHPSVNQDTMPYLQCSFGQFYHVPAAVIQERVAKLAANKNIETKPEATIIGYTPEQAQRVAIKALGRGIEEYWRTRSERYM